MSKFPEIWKKIFILGPFCPFSRQWIFFEKSGFRTISRGFLSPCQKLEKTNDQIPRKLPDRCMDGETLFHRTLPAMARGPVKNFDSFPTDWINWKIQFLFSDLKGKLKGKLQVKKKIYFPGFQKFSLDFQGFPGHTMKFQVFPGFPGLLATLFWCFYRRVKFSLF